MVDDDDLHRTKCAARVFEQLGNFVLLGQVGLDILHLGLAELGLERV